MHRVSAAGAALPTRRDLLAALPAAGVATFAAGAGSAGPDDPILPLYREWLAAREEWIRWADAPGNGDWDWPQSVEAMEREYAALDAMLEARATSMAGIAALAHVLWAQDGPCLNPASPEYADELNSLQHRLQLALWRSASGEAGLPGEGA